MTTGAEIDDAKQLLRTAMRSVRNGLPDRSERSARILAVLTRHPAVLGADRVMVYASLAGEPDTAALLDWCLEQGKQTCVPEDCDPEDGDPEDGVVDAAWPDVIIVPGLAFTRDGKRLGQGGGWYDRFLPGRRADCTTIGICFAPQLVDDLATDDHDIVLDLVLSD